MRGSSKDHWSSVKFHVSCSMFHVPRSMCQVTRSKFQVSRYPCEGVNIEQLYEILRGSKGGTFGGTGWGNGLTRAIPCGRNLKGRGFF